MGFISKNIGLSSTSRKSTAPIFVMELIAFNIFFLKEKSLLGKYDLSKWSQEKYVQEILWLRDGYCISLHEA